jgi:hypothetical protein
MRSFSPLYLRFKVHHRLLSELRSSTLRSTLSSTRTRSLKRWAIGSL